MALTKKNKDENSNIELYNEERNIKFQKVSSKLSKLFGTFKNKRASTKEQDWIRFQMQYDGKYDAKTISEFKKGKSQFYDPVTTAKVDQFKSRCTELVLPNGDKNFAINSTPHPNLPKEVVNETLSLLKANALQNKQKLTKEDIDTAIYTIATKRADRMEDTCFDQLLESDYSQIISNVLLSSAIYGTGVSKGPFNIKEKVTSYEEDEYGNWSAVTKEVFKPFFEFVRIWDFFPDLDAKKFGQDCGAFFYHTFNKGDFAKLSKRPDFLGANIKEYLINKPNGNFVLESYESQLSSTGNENQTSLTQNKYRLVEYWGSVSRDCVSEIFEDLPDDIFDVEVNVWMVDNIVIKCILNPFDSGRRPYQVFNYKVTDSMLLGTGLCKLLEQYQRALNSVGRAILNNMAYVAEPIFELNDDLLAAGYNVNEIFPGMVIKREGLDQSSAYPALKTIPVINHVDVLLQLQAMLRRNIDDISNLQQIMQGDMQGQATLGRTSSGISQLMGAANITLREFARNFDFYNQHLISLLIEWNQMFNDDDQVQGDFKAYPRVSTALIEKQLTATKLNDLSTTMTEQEWMYIDTEKLLDARLRANNLDPDLVKLSDKKIEENQAQQAQQQQMAMQQQQEAQEMAKAQAQAQIQSLNSKSQADIIKAQAQIEQNSDNTELNRIKTLHSVENDRNKQALQEAQLKNTIMNEDREQNLQKEDIANVVNSINGLNPNLNV